jgi:SAM-dependent methyltransferase
MTERSDTEHQGRWLRLDPDWRWHRPKPRGRSTHGEPLPDERPIRCETRDGVRSGPAGHLPFPDGQFDLVECGSLFAYARNDEALARELARITATGGRVQLRVPAAGVLAVLDAFNLHRYLVDTTHRGLRPFETADIGWRRHYRESDLVGLFGPRGFSLAACSRVGFGASEVVWLSGFVLFRWLRASRDWYRRVSRLAQRVLRLEQRVAWRNGYWLEATLVRADPQHFERAVIR